MNRHGGEAAVSLHLIKTRFGKVYSARNLVLILTLGMMTVVMLHPFESWTAVVFWWGALGLVLAIVLVGRALFYALVVPTTMPGAFFWRNAGFENHARQTGLVDLPQVGVIAGNHCSTVFHSHTPILSGILAPHLAPLWAL